MTERWVWQRLRPEAHQVMVTEWGGRTTHQPHDHDFIELTVITAGRGRHRCAAGDLDLGPGSVLVVGPGTWHAYEDGDGLAGMDCCIHPGLLHRELAWLVGDPLVAPLLWGWRRGQRRSGLVSLRLDDPTRGRVTGSLLALRALRWLPAEQGRPDQLGHLLLVLGEVARALAGGVAPAPGSRTDPAVAEVLRALDDGLARPWTLAELAGRVGLSPDRLTRVFRAAVGEPPMAYLARLRAERAAGLLLRTADPVAGIGAAVGWPDANYCARRFRERFGCSPSEYRRRFADRIMPESC